MPARLRPPATQGGRRESCEAIADSCKDHESVEAEVDRHQRSQGSTHHGGPTVDAPSPRDPLWMGAAEPLQSQRERHPHRKCQGGDNYHADERLPAQSQRHCYSEDHRRETQVQKTEQHDRSDHPTDSRFERSAIRTTESGCRTATQTGKYEESGERRCHGEDRASDVHRHSLDIGDFEQEEGHTQSCEEAPPDDLLFASPPPAQPE